MALLDEHALSQDTDFNKRVTMAAERKAVSIFSESAGGLAISARKKLARQVLTEPIEAARGLSILLARDSVIAAKAATPLTITDAEITTALSDALWNGYAEAFFA